MVLSGTTALHCEPDFPPARFFEDCHIYTAIASSREGGNGSSPVISRQKIFSQLYSAAAAATSSILELKKLFYQQFVISDIVWLGLMDNSGKLFFQAYFQTFPPCSNLRIGWIFRLSEDTNYSIQSLKNRISLRIAIQILATENWV
jgi:hypothetical protein